MYEEARDAGLPATGSWLIGGEDALAVGGAQQEPEPAEVVGQRLGAASLGFDAEETSQGRGEVVAVGFHSAGEELRQLLEFDGVGHFQGHLHHVASAQIDSGPPDGLRADCVTCEEAVEIAAEWFRGHVERMTSPRAVASRSLRPRRAGSAPWACAERACGERAGTIS